METTLREVCVALRKEGYTLSEIVERTGGPKTTVYSYIRDLPLSAERKDSIRQRAGDRMREFALSRKGKSVRMFKEFSTWSPQLVLLVAHLIFDGELSSSGCRYNNRSGALIQRVRTLMKGIYDFDPKLYVNPITGVTKIGYNNVALGTYLLKKAEELLEEIERMPRECKREFLRAFFDDEGCMDFRPARNKRRVRGYQKNIRILSIVQSLLADLDINAHIVLPNEVLITGKSELLKFQKEINFSPGVRVNGNRSNSIWKEHVEKRDLLARAIDSYQI